MKNRYFPFVKELSCQDHMWVVGSHNLMKLIAVVSRTSNQKFPSIIISSKWNGKWTLVTWTARDLFSKHKTCKSVEWSKVKRNVLRSLTVCDRMRGGSFSHFAMKISWKWFSFSAFVLLFNFLCFSMSHLLDKLVQHTLKFLHSSRWHFNEHQENC